MKQCFSEDNKFKSVITIYTDSWNGEKNWTSARREQTNQTKNWADFLQYESGYSGQLVSCAGTVQHLYQSEP